MLLDTLISRPWKLFGVRKFVFLSVKVLSFDLHFSDQYRPVREYSSLQLRVELKNGSALVLA